MESKDFKEAIHHNTEKRPFSIHDTHISPDVNPVLHKHWHTEFEFFIMQTGDVDFFIEGIKIPLSQGEAVFIPPNLLHRAERKDKTPYHYGAVVFHADLFLSFGGNLFGRYIQPVLFNSGAYVLKLSDDTEWQSSALGLLSKILSYYDAPNIDEWELTFYGLLLQLWDVLYGNHLRKGNDAGNVRRLACKLASSMEYIHIQYENEISIDALAALSNVSAGTFCRYFKQLNGCTPMSYVNRYRIHKCCERLICSDIKITDAAFQSGFNNLSHFNREFQKVMRCAPSAYRKEGECRAVQQQ